MRHIAGVPGAVTMVALAALLWRLGISLTHVGSTTMYAGAGACVLIAGGAALGKRWAGWATLVLLSIVGVVAFVAAVELGSLAAHSRGKSGQAAIGVLIGGAGAVAMTIVAVMSIVVAALVGYELRRAAGLRRGLAGVQSLLGGMVLAAAVLWIVGHQYLYRQLWEQDRCWGGVASACASLAAVGDPLDAFRPSATGRRAAEVMVEADHSWREWLQSRFPAFSLRERHGFAREGCAGGAAAACSLVAAFVAGGLVPPPFDRNDDLALLRERCATSDMRGCLEAASVLRNDAAEESLALATLACERIPARCVQAARLMKQNSDSRLALYRSGCDRDDVDACRGLLNEFGRRMEPVDVASMRRYVCMAGNVNDCLPLMRADPQDVCPEICAGTTALRAQSCRECANLAAERGMTALAAQWRGQACAAEPRAECRKDARPSVALRP